MRVSVSATLLPPLVRCRFETGLRPREWVGGLEVVATTRRQQYR